MAIKTSRKQVALALAGFLALPMIKPLPMWAATEIDAAIQSLTSGDASKVKIAQRILAVELWRTQNGLLRQRILSEGAPDGKRLIEAVSALHVGKAEQGEAALEFLMNVGAYDILTEQISAPNFLIATKAVQLVEERHITTALPKIKSALLSSIGVISGGGTELQQMRNSYIKALWRAYLSLTNDVKSNWDEVPDRAQLEKVLQ